MRWIGFVAVAVWAHAVSAAPRAWAIDPPAGWQENAAAEEQLRGIWRGASYVQRNDARVWRSADGNSILMLQWFLLSLHDDTEIDDVDRGWIKGMFGPGQPISRQERIVGSMLVREVSGENQQSIKHGHLCMS